LPVGSALIALVMYLLLCLFFIHKSRRIATGVDCDTHNSSSIIGITVFFMQTAALLPRENLSFGWAGNIAFTFLGPLRALLTFCKHKIRRLIDLALQPSIQSAVRFLRPEHFREIACSYFRAGLTG
jgi:low temperature requirement protein LtrA